MVGVLIRPLGKHVLSLHETNHCVYTAVIPESLDNDNQLLFRAASQYPEKLEAALRVHFTLTAAAVGGPLAIAFCLSGAASRVSSVCGLPACTRGSLDSYCATFEHAENTGHARWRLPTQCRSIAKGSPAARRSSRQVWITDLITICRHIPAAPAYHSPTPLCVSELPAGKCCLADGT